MVPKLKKRVEQLTVGDPREGNTITPLIDEKAADFAQSLIDDAMKLGAVMVTGNRREKNLFYPTLLDQVTPEMKVAWIEPFAPVLPVLRVKEDVYKRQA